MRIKHTLQVGSLQGSLSDNKRTSINTSVNWHLPPNLTLVDSIRHFGGDRMSTYKRLADHERDRRRSIRDALEVLRSIPEYSDQSRAKVRVTGLRLHPGDDKPVGLVELEFTCGSCDTIYLVSLPTSEQFRARNEASLRSNDYAIADLDGAVVDGGGAVELRDGRRLHAVEMMPTCALSQPTELDWLIVHHTVSMIEGASVRCYRSLRDQDNLAPSIREMTPDLRFLDCNTIWDLKGVPGPKRIVHSLGKKYPDLEIPSPQKVSDALRKYSIRVPKPRSVRRRSATN